MEWTLRGEGPKLKTQNKGKNKMDTYTPQEIALLRAFKHIVNGYTYDEYADKMKSQHQRIIGHPTWWALLLAVCGYSHTEGIGGLATREDA